MEEKQIEKEIGLIGLTKLIIKRKAILLVSAFLFISIACVVLLIPPKIFQLAILIDTEGTTYNKLDDFIIKIKEGGFNDRVFRALKLDPFEVKMSFDASYPRESKIVKISTKKLSKDIDLGLKMLKNLYEEIYKENEENIDDILFSMDRKDSPLIGSYNNMILFNKNEIKVKEERLIVIDEEIKKNSEKLPELEENYEKVSKQNEKYIMGKVNLDKGINEKFSNLIQKNNELLNRNYSLMQKLKENISNLKSEKESISSVIRNMNLENEKFAIEISKINLPKFREDYKSVILLRAPYLDNVQTILKKSIKIIISGVLGFIFGIFLILIIELFSKANVELKNEI
ncbi:MAG: hypothetical protein A2539_07675 [Elusimicrobia bacterium RIFOXYD2_FULL_34_15]|nr:MAG: hypothetical protein A2539_07675 [Elusimicrobia bacterium RIFOXYD2_FULL_34_15]